MCAYIRFAIHRKDEDSGRSLGIFQAAAELRDQGDIEAWERDLLYELKNWFNENLDKPDRFTASKPPYYRKQPKAISWFKDTAVEHIRRARQMVEVLDSHSVAVDTYTTDLAWHAPRNVNAIVLAELPTTFISPFDCSGPSP